MYAGLLLSLGPVLPSSRAFAVGNGPDQQPIMQAAWFAIYACVLLVATRRQVFLRAIALENVALLLPVICATVSVVWSDAPSLTTRRVIALALSTAFGLALSRLMTLRELFDAVCWVLGALLLLSLVVSLLDPSYGIDYLRGGAWQGVFATKNELGRAAALGVGLWTLRSITLGSVSRNVGMVVLSLYLLERSNSRTSFAVAAAAALLALLMPMLRAQWTLAVAGLMFAAGSALAFGFWLVTHQETVLSTFNATPTLTGRTQIWSAVWEMIRKRPLFGYGYDAFWRGMNGPSAQVWSAVGSTPPTAHNGLLDVWLAVGFVGVAAVSIALISSFRLAWRLVRNSGSPLNGWPIFFLAFLVLSNLTESNLLTRNSIYWILLVAVSAQARRYAPARESVRDLDAFSVAGLAASSR